jgi:hypothetical protein
MARYAATSTSYAKQPDLQAAQATLSTGFIAPLVRAVYRTDRARLNNGGTRTNGNHGYTFNWTNGGNPLPTINIPTLMASPRVVESYRTAFNQLGVGEPDRSEKHDQRRP